MPQSYTLFMKMLEDEDLELVIAKDGCIIYRGRGEGLKPLIDAIDMLGSDRLKGHILADRVVGLAVSYIAVYVGFSEIHCLIVSRHALDYLESRGVKVFWARLVDVILDRSKSSICPFEKLALESGDPGKFYSSIRVRIGFEDIRGG